MLENYYVNGMINTDEETQRLIAVQIALEIIKAAVATPVNSKNIAYDLEEAIKFLPRLTDAIQSTIEKK